MTPIRRTRYCGICAFLLVLVATYGCGTSQYDAIFEKQVKQVRKEAPWAKFWDYSTLPGTPIKVRIPEIFAKSYQLNSPHEQDDGPILQSRVQPPFLKLPGFRLMFESFYSEGSTQAPYYCYLAANKATPQQVQAMAADLLAKVAAAMSADANSLKWEEVDVKTTEGGTASWKKLTAAGNQSFEIDMGANVTPGVQSRNMQGTFELWLYEGEGWYVLLGWRINSDKNKTIGLDKLAPLTAGTVQIGEAAAAPAAQ